MNGQNPGHPPDDAGDTPLPEAFSELSHHQVDPSAVKLLSYRFCVRYHVVALGPLLPDRDEPINVGLLPNHAPQLIGELERMLSRPVRPVYLNAFEIERALVMGHEGEAAVSDAVQLTLAPVEQFTFGRDADASGLLDEILGHAITRGATDIHLESYDGDADVRLRISGTLVPVRTPFSPANAPQLLARIKVLAGLDISERRRAQDGRIRTRIRDADGRDRGIDFRISIVPGPYGEDAVLRVLDSDAPTLGLEGLGLDAQALEQFEALIGNPEGLVLVCGPTSSGKTTTLYAAIGTINTHANKVLTVEDPIEYHFPKVNQKQVSEQMGFADYTRAFMRQNPDVILVGEVRDAQTAEAAVRAAQTGHLVLSTLHTIDSTRAVSRLDMLGIDRRLTANTLLAALYQRLGRRLCEHCLEEQPPNGEQRARLRLPPGEQSFFTGRGCEQCNFTGYKGRVGLYELFVPSHAIADLIADGAPLHRIRAAAVEEGMRTLMHDALDKARKGIVSLEEVLRAVPYRMAYERPARG